MLSFLASIRRKSLFTTLFLSIFLLAGLSMVSSLTGWFLLDDIRESQQRLSTNTIPLISAAQSMATQSAAVAFITPQITRVEDEIALDDLYSQIYKHLDVMDSLKGRISNKQLGSIDGGTISTTISDIDSNLGRLREKVSAKFLLNQLTKEAVDSAVMKLREIDALVDQQIADLSDNSFQLANQIRKSGVGDRDQHLNRLIDLNQDSEVLFNLDRKVLRAEALLKSLRQEFRYSDLREIKSRIDFQVRSMVSQSVVLLDSANKKRMSVLLSELYRELNLKVNVEYLQRQLVTHNLELMEIDTQVKNDVFYLNRLINEVVDRAEIATIEDSEAVNAATALDSNILLAVAILSLIVSVIVVWFFVIQKIILPLNEVKGQIRKLSNNQLDISISSHAMLELNEISQALEVFRNNAIALNEHKNELIESNALLTRSNDDLNAFVHVASHDLKTPLRGIRVLSEFIASDMREGNLDDAQSNVNLLQQRIVRLGQLLDSLLDYTKLDSTPGVVRRVDVTKIIKEAFGLVRNANRFELIFPQQLPECQVIESDLMVAFLNLFDNSISHHDRKNGQITVYFSERDNDYVFEVRDDGPGIEVSFQKRIFNVLQKLETKDSVEGSGVGLAHVKRLLESRGGQISVISNPEVERGCRFIFHYPKMELEQ